MNPETNKQLVQITDEDQLAQLLTLEPTITQQEQEYFLRLNHSERAAELRSRKVQRSR